VWGRIMSGWADPRTQRATAFYCLLGVLCSHIYHTGLDQWDLSALVLMTGLATVSSVTDILTRRKTEPPADPPGGQG
jgi:hypothetical protein